MTVWAPYHCFAPSTICSLCPCMMSNCHCCAPSTICSLYSCMMSNWQCRAPSTICSLCPLYGAQTVITVLHLPYVPCAPVWCPNCHCCAPSTICSLCPCMVSKLSLMCSIYHMFLVPLYGVQTDTAVLHLPYVPCAPVWCPNCHCCAPSTICSSCPCMVSNLSLLCSIYHMFLVPLYGAQTVGAQGTYGRWSTVITVWAPYRGTRNIW